MKSGIKFILTYYGISVLLLFLSVFVVPSIRGEIIAYLIWFYIMNLVIGIIVFPPIVWALKKIELDTIGKSIICFLILLVILNIPFWADDGHVLTVDVFKGFFQGQPSLIGFNNVGLHVIAIISFVISSLLFHKNKFLSDNSTLQS